MTWANARLNLALGAGLIAVVGTFVDGSSLS